jgi:hypothetical protein
MHETNDLYIITPKNGEKITLLKNFSKSPNNSDTPLYTHMKNYNDLGYIMFSKDYAGIQHGFILLINLKNGSQYSFDTIPIISPDKNRLYTDPYGILVYKVNEKEIKLECELYPYETDDFFSVISWENNSSISFNFAYFKNKKKVLVKDSINKNLLLSKSGCKVDDNEGNESYDWYRLISTL